MNKLYCCIVIQLNENLQKNFDVKMRTTPACTISNLMGWTKEQIRQSRGIVPVFILISDMMITIVADLSLKRCLHLHTDNRIVVLSGFSHSSSSSSKQDSAGHFMKIIQSRSFLYIVLIVVSNIFFLAPCLVRTTDGIKRESKRECQMQMSVQMFWQRCTPYKSHREHG